MGQFYRLMKKQDEKPVGVVGIITRTNSKGDTEYLLVRSKANYGKFTGFWYPPGGHIEEDEEESAALVREIKEELDLDIKTVRKIAQLPGDVIKAVGYWECEVLSGDISADEAEIEEHGFFTLDQMENMKIWPSTKEFFDKYIEKPSLQTT